MKYLYFKENGKLWIKSPKRESDLDAQFPLSLCVPSNYETLIDDGVDSEGIGTKREKTFQEIEAELTYRDKRESEYPDIGDQLDSLFHAGVFPEEMASRIKEIKNKYPKGQ